MADFLVSLNPADISALADAIVVRLQDRPQPPSGDIAGKLLWREDEAAAALGVKPATLQKWRLRGYIKASTSDRPVLYTREQLEAAARFIIESHKP